MCACMHVFSLPFVDRLSLTSAVLKASPTTSLCHVKEWHSRGERKRKIILLCTVRCFALLQVLHRQERIPSSDFFAGLLCAL